MRKAMLCLAIAVLFAASAAFDGRRANLARGQQRRHCGAEFYADRARRVSRMGTLLPAWIHARLRRFRRWCRSKNGAAAAGGPAICGFSATR